MLAAIPANVPISTDHMKSNLSELENPMFKKITTAISDFFMTILAEVAMFGVQDEERQRREHARIEAELGV